MKTVPNQKIRCYFKANILKGGIFVENTETGNAAAKETKEKRIRAIRKPRLLLHKKGVAAVGLNFYFTKIQNKIYYNVII